MSTPVLDGRSTRWDAHRTARRAELVDAALRAITRLGPDVGMDDIATEAGTSKTVLYRHFADKGQLHRAVAARVDRRVVSALRTAVLAASDSRTALAAAVTTYLHLVRDDPRVYRFVVSPPAHGHHEPDPVDGLSSAISAELARLIAARLSPADPSRAVPQVAPWAHGLIALVRAAADTWAAQSPRTEADVLAAQLTSLVWDGLGATLDVPGAGPDPLAPPHAPPLHAAPPTTQEQQP